MPDEPTGDGPVIVPPIMDFEPEPAPPNPPEEQPNPIPTEEPPAPQPWPNEPEIPQNPDEGE